MIKGDERAGAEDASSERLLLSPHVCHRSFLLGRAGDNYNLRVGK